MHVFANGGGQAVVIRLPVDKAVKAASKVKQDGGSSVSMTVTALSSGAAGNDLFVEIDPFDIGAHPYSPTDPKHDKTRFNLTLVDAATGTGTA